jgi:EAL domain-containing protein (putative c-di-GMP-specific phosphodiesterase class I)
MSESQPIHARDIDEALRQTATVVPSLDPLLASPSDAAETTAGRVADASGGGVKPRVTRSALAYSAGASRSEMLIDHAKMDGMFYEPAHLVMESEATETDMLGSSAVGERSSHLESSAGSVREALMSGSPPLRRPAMDLAQLRVALSGTMIENRYQPIARMADRQPIGLEALVRLNHPELGTLLPDCFVPQIEDAGLAARLTDLVSARAFADMGGPVLEGSKVRMSVNFPLDVLLHPAALDRLREQQTGHGILAGRIIIELTESRPVSDFGLLRRSIDRLRDWGFGVAIDDAGPAVPWLTELLDLPFTSLKLDKDLVKQVTESDAVRRFIASTITQGKSRGMTVVAEGVETAMLWDHMRALGADEAQGFLVARPLPLAAVPDWTDAWLARTPSGFI